MMPSVLSSSLAAVLMSKPVLHLPPAVPETYCPHFFLQISLFHVFFGRPLFSWPCGVHFSSDVKDLRSEDKDKKLRSENKDKDKNL